MTRVCKGATPFIHSFSAFDPSSSSTNGQEKKCLEWMKCDEWTRKKKVQRRPRGKVTTSCSRLDCRPIKSINSPLYLRHKFPSNFGHLLNLIQFNDIFFVWNLTICWTKFVNFSSNSWIFSFIPFVGQRNDSMKGNYSPRVSSAPARSIHPSIHSEEATPWPPSEWMGQINGARPFFRIISTLSRKKKS